MPSKSEKQHKFMEIAAHDKEFADAHGIDQKVAREFIEADKKKKESESSSSPASESHSEGLSIPTQPPEGWMEWH
jgi:hypothetical protein